MACLQFSDKPNIAEIFISSSGVPVSTAGVYNTERGTTRVNCDTSKSKNYPFTGVKRKPRAQTLLIRALIHLSNFVSYQLFVLEAKSCKELLDASFTKNGVYRIHFNNSQLINVYCDQSSRGGGKKEKTYLSLGMKFPNSKTHALKKQKSFFPSASFEEIFN